MKTQVEVPEAVQVEIKKNRIKVSGPLGKSERVFPIRKIEIKIENSTVKLIARKDNALTKAVVGTFASHIENMVKGVQEKFVYKLKICSIHFPMTVKVESNNFRISNFLGGKKSRVIKIPLEVEVNISGDVIEVTSISKELAGSFAARIEQKTKPKRKDRRVFQDGIYITEKAGKEMI